MLIKLACCWLGGRSIERRATSNSVNNEATEDLWREVFRRGLFFETGCVCTVHQRSTTTCILQPPPLSCDGWDFCRIHPFLQSHKRVCPLPAATKPPRTASSQTQHPPLPNANGVEHELLSQKQRRHRCRRLGRQCSGSSSSRQR